MIKKREDSNTISTPKLMQVVRSEATMQCEKSINNVMIHKAKKKRPPKKEA